MLIKRILRPIVDAFIGAEPVAVGCIRHLADACIEGFAAAGFALHGLPPDLYRNSEAHSEHDEVQRWQKERLQETESKMMGRRIYPKLVNDERVPTSQPPKLTLVVVGHSTDESVTLVEPRLACLQGNAPAPRRFRRTQAGIPPPR